MGMDFGRTNYKPLLLFLNLEEMEEKEAKKHERSMAAGHKRL